jgi:hypothetical protein
MKPLRIILLLLFVGSHFCRAQDTTVLLSPNMFDTTSRLVFISKMNGWLFKPGNDTTWAKKDLDAAGWKRLMPTELSARYADNSGRVECWFRIKIKLDASFAICQSVLEMVHDMTEQSRWICK